MRSSSGPCKPTAGEIRAAIGRRIPDVIGPELKVLFCGVNPGLYSAATQRHFARPGNRFWPALHLAGFTTRLLAPHESHELLGSGMRDHESGTSSHRDSSRGGATGARGGQAQTRSHGAHLSSALGCGVRCGCLSHSFCPAKCASRPARYAGRQQRLAASQPQRRERKLPSGGSHP